jgi:hypothetical protein
MSHVNITNGVVLDPFSIHCTGLLRKHFGLKTGVNGSEIFNGLHGEAKYKQAFVNACHFAESMTVVGPVASLAWDTDYTSSVVQALLWKGDPLKGDNDAWLNHVKTFLKKAAWDRVPEDKWCAEKEFLLHTLPDFSFSRHLHYEHDQAFLPWQDNNEHLMRHLFRKNVSAGKIMRPEVFKQFETLGIEGEAATGKAMPTLGLMAVIFTFKKPVGILGINELTNLGSWPPVVFFLPVQVPAGVSMNQTGGGIVNQTLRQPMMSTYRICLKNDKNILPYGQPFFLSSVKNKGKAPDTLRSLSDVFKALWSQATQWSAWNMSFEADLEAEPHKYQSLSGAAWDNFVGEFCLDPMGAGRRIRGHNRHMSKYDLSDVSFMWENAFKEHELMAYNPICVDKRPFFRQLRATNTRKRETIFVMPSFLGEGTTHEMMPLALAMARFMYASHAGLEGFLNGRLLANTNPRVAGTDENITPEEWPESFMDGVHAAMNRDVDKKNKGPLPLHRIKADLEFNAEGDPNVFGLSVDKDVVEKLGKSVHTQPEKKDFEEMVAKTGVMSNFHFTEAFCSKSTKDLTEVFGEVKEKSFKEGTKAKELLDEDLAIDLFDENIGMI